MDFIIDNFDKLFDSEQHLKKLEEIILDLAVKGKLVPQNPNDEPASVLLEKIKAEKEKLIKEKKIKKDKELEPINEEEKPFEIPASWEWVRLGNIGQTNIGLTYSPNDIVTNDNGIPVLRSNNIKNGKIILDDLVRVNKEINEGLLVNKGDILICARNGSKKLVGKAAQIKELNEKMSFGAFMAILKTSISDYAEIFINSPIYRASLEGINTTTINQITQNNLKNTIISLPPLAEQKKIVEKIDSLKKLIDTLKEKAKFRDRTREELKKSIMAEIEKSDSNVDLLNSLEMVFKNFDTIVKNKEDIKDIRDLILSMAVKGKLVPQNSDDEPASVLLEKIKAEKEKLIKEKKIKKDKELELINEDEKPFEIPDSWEWVRLGEISELITKGSSPNWQGINYIEENGVLFITSENVGAYNLLLEKKKFLEWKFNDIQPRSILKKGDLLMNIVGGSIGRTAIFDLEETSNINQAVCLIRLIKDELNLRYMLFFFNSQTCINYMFDKQVDNARANLSMGNIAKFLIPLPPLAEQKRIVEKVDKLMTLCDDLETKVEKSQKEFENILESAIKEVTANNAN